MKTNVAMHNLQDFTYAINIERGVIIDRKCSMSAFSVTI